MKTFIHLFFVAFLLFSSVALPLAYAQTLPTTGTPAPATTQTTQGTSIELPNPLGSGVGTIESLLGKLIDGLILFATPVVVIMVIWAGYLFISAGGEPDKITQARSTLLYAVLGYGILLLAKGIGLVISNFLRG